MTNQAIQITVQERINKLASNDFDNIEAWQIMEAYNKVQIEWCRTQLHGGNLYKEGGEQSTRRVDDLQCLITTVPLPGYHKPEYFISESIPADYLQMNRVSGYATRPECEGKRKLKIYPSEVANNDDNEMDENKKASWDWAETFFAMEGNKIKISIDDFKIEDATLTYYRLPRYVMFDGAVDIVTGNVINGDIECEFKNDIAAILIDLTVALLTGDLGDYTNNQRSAQNAEKVN